MVVREYKFTFLKESYSRKFSKRQVYIFKYLNINNKILILVYFKNHTRYIQTMNSPLIVEPSIY